MKNNKLTSKHINNDKGSITTLFDAMKRKLSPEKYADTPCDKQEKYTEIYNLIYSKQCYIRNWSHDVD